MKPSIDFRRPATIGKIFLAMPLMMLVLSGCEQRVPITHVTVPADQSGVVLEPPPEQGRMVVAIRELKDRTWTFKISGALEIVDDTQPKWMEFFKQLDFVNNDPKWELPEGWEEVEITPGPFAPFARLRIKDDLTMSISRMPGGFDMLGNINRWRGQLSLPPTDSIDLTPIADDSKSPLKLFEIQGLLAGGGGGMKPPFAGGPASMGARPNGPAAPSSAITFDEIEGWESGPSSDIVAARFSQVEGEATAQITVTKLPKDLNSWAQVSRNWAGELRLESLSDEELAHRTSKVEVDSSVGSSIRFLEDEPGMTRGLIGVRVSKGPDAWFIKMSGDKKLVSQNEEAFVRFVQSIRFK